MGACDWTWASFDALKQLIAEDPESVYGRLAMERIDQRLDPTMTVVQEDEIVKLWVSQASPAQEVFEKALAEQWRKTGCEATSAPYVLRALIARSFPEQSGAGKVSRVCLCRRGVVSWCPWALRAPPQSPKP
jgi:hypothetical protein